MPCALVLPLKPLNAAPVPAAICDCVHAAFFALIDSVDPGEDELRAALQQARQRIEQAQNEARLSLDDREMI